MPKYPHPTATTVPASSAGYDNSDGTTVQGVLDDFDAAISSAGGGGGGPLAVVRYTPGSDGAPTYNTNSTSLVDIDATNAIITFTAPASGNVLVDVAMSLHSASSNNTHLGIREGSSDIAGPQLVINNSQIVCVRRSFYITGISAGSHTYKAAWSVDGSAANIYLGPTYGALELTVWDAG